MPDKIAIFGGSFNPIHNGHLSVALHALKECKLSKLVFLPNANPPHKKLTNLISAQHRYNMVSLAISDYTGFEISDYEMKSPSPSYTIDTMRHMKSVYDADLYFIIGADSLFTVNTWKSHELLLKECKFIVADRNCKEGTALKECADSLNAQGACIQVISMPKIDVTSTMIRDMLANGRDIAGYVPEKVRDYIIGNNLYKTHLEDKR